MNRLMTTVAKISLLGAVLALPLPLHADKNYLGQSPATYKPLNQAAIDQLNKLYKSGKISSDEYQTRLAELTHNVSGVKSDLITASAPKSGSSSAIASRLPRAPIAPVVPVAAVAISSPDACAAANNGFSLYSVSTDSLTQTSTETCILRQKNADGSTAVTSYILNASSAASSSASGYKQDPAECAFLTDFPPVGASTAPIHCGAENQTFENADGSFSSYAIYYVGSNADLKAAQASLATIDKKSGSTKVTYAGAANGYFQINWLVGSGVFCGTPAAAKTSSACTPPTDGPVTSLISWLVN